jgi:5-methylcytosine-specific restriction enzyme subunit McrC
LPALRTEVKTRGTTLRGSLSVRDSVALRAAGRPEVVSVRRERTLDHALSDVIVAAYTVLRREMRKLPSLPWPPPQVASLMPALIAASGPRPAVPSAAELARIRYTPITAGFARVAELSRRIALRQGMGVNAAVDGQAQGLLLDVAELWELHVLDVLRRSQPLEVCHGTREPRARGSLLRSAANGRALGTLIPDALVYEGGRVRVVVDAKYKNVREPQREDLYQMTAYLQHFRTPGRPAAGMLVYPRDPLNPASSAIEEGNPWRFDDDTQLRFVALPLDDAAAGAHCAGIIADITDKEFE